MAAQDLLRNKVDETPSIYAYTLPDVPKYRGLLKVGYTSRPGTVRIKEQGHELYLDKEIVPSQELWCAPTARTSWTRAWAAYTTICAGARIPNPFGEWFRCSAKDGASGPSMSLWSGATA